MSSKPCGCCEGVHPVTPVATGNRPGLPALAYRVGTHAGFLETMKARLSSPDFPALAALTTRDSSDPAIALLDAWAMLGDILTFYQERIANEGYLRTATERRSILELARLVGYRLRPGVAASVYLAFTLEDNSETVIPAGSKSQSIPGPGQLPQTFETSDDLPATSRWNNLQPRTSRPQLIDPSSIRPGRRVYFKGIATNLKPNDPILFDGDYDARRLQGVLDPTHVQRVLEVSTDPVANRTTVVLEPWALIQISPAVHALAAPGDGVSDQLHAIVERYLDTGKFHGRGLPTDIPLDTQIARRVDASLNALLQSLSATPAPDGTGPTLDSTRVQVRDEHRLATDGKYPRLGPWLDDLVTDLEQVAPAPATAPVAPAPPAPAPAGGAAPAALAVPAVKSPGPDPSAILRGLATPPATPIARDAQRLVKSLKDTFAQGSSAGAQLLSAIEPAVADNLYTALGNLVNPTAPTARAALTMRVKAAPFGSLAPLKPVLDDKGVAVDTEEWPIRSRVLGLTITTTAQPGAFLVGIPDLANVQAQATVQRGGETRMVDITPDAAAATTSNFPAPQFAPNDNLSVVTTVAKKNGDQIDTLTFDFKDAAGNSFKKIVVTPNPPPVVAIHVASGVRGFAQPGEQYGVQVGDDAQRTVLVGEAIRYEQGGRDVTIEAPALDRTLLRVLEASADAGPDPSPYALNVLTLDAQYDQIAVGSRLLIERLAPPAAAAPPAPPPPAAGAGAGAGGAAAGAAAAGAAATPQVQALDIYVVRQVRTVSKAEYGITGKVTEAVLDRPWLTATDTSLALFRQVTVYAQEDRLELADEPFDGDVEGNIIELDGVYKGLEPGRWVIVSGERTDIPGTEGNWDAELVMLAGTDLVALTYVPLRDPVTSLVVPNGDTLALPGDALHTVLRLANPLAYSYKRDTVTVYGNVVHATHGETRKEVLGNGNGSQSFQRFSLKQPPLTYVSADTPSGVESTLDVYVNDVKWHETTRPDLLGPTDRGFTTSTGDDDVVTITFGDGVHGARLPSGIENVRAVYRFGIGVPGNVDKGQISQLSTRPLHVKSVINPRAASGGADREDRDQARRNVPLGLSALDRLVSTSDYEDFARTFAGIAKASAVRLTNGRQQVVHLTVAGADDAPLDPSSDLYHNLRQALSDFGDPAQIVVVDSRILRLLVLDASIHIDADHVWEVVVAAVQAALFDAFSFDRRELGQDAYLSEVIRLMQSVPGVDYVDVTVFGAIPPVDFDTSITLTPDLLAQMVTDLAADQKAAGHPGARVPVSLAQFIGGAIRPAQIAVLSADARITLNLRQITP